MKSCDVLGEQVLGVYSPLGRATSVRLGMKPAKGHEHGLGTCIGKPKVLATGAEDQKATLSSIGSTVSCKKRPEAANIVWSTGCSVQWIRRFEVRKRISRPSTKLASRGVKSTAYYSVEYNSIRLIGMFATNEPSAFLTARSLDEYLGISNHLSSFAIGMRSLGDRPRVGQPHYLASFDLMPAGKIVVYTPRDEQELAVCDLLFSLSYRFACGAMSGGG